MSTSRLSPTEIQAGDLLLRPFALSDEPGVAIALADPGILRWTAGTAVMQLPAAQRAKAWLEPRVRAWTLGNAVFAVADVTSGDLLGAVSLRDVHRIPDQALAAYWVTPSARGRRLGARALDAASRWAFAPQSGNGLGLHRISLDHALVNEGSCRVAIAAGFQLEGVMREYYVEPSGRRHNSHLHARLATDPGLQGQG